MLERTLLERLTLLFVVCVATNCKFDPSALAPSTPSEDAAVVLPARHCQGIVERGESRGDGLYLIDPDGENGNPAFEVFCDMSTNGGGWTLVYAYTFTDYDNFSSGGNAITPRPSWTYSDTGSSVPVSTTPPVALHDYAAIDFALWKDVGTSFQVRSNINHWLICDEGSGSLVQEIEGDIACRIEKQVATACTTDLPVTIHPFWSGRGPTINGSGHYYYWDGATDNSWPTHDPCGNNQANHLTGVASPSGAIFLRP